jgi:hypothetical protein
MKRHFMLALLVGLALFVSGAGVSARAHVKQVRMKIDGYLCGN